MHKIARHTTYTSCSITPYDMIQLNLQTQENLNARITQRLGEIKLGETVTTLKNLDALAETTGRYVVFGICEDIGVQANFGKTGTKRAWEAFLDAFLNVQSSETMGGSTIAILGYISVIPDERITSKTPKKTLGELVERIDKKVSDLIYRIVGAGKFPIIIGGGHNNALGNLKGSSRALNTALNVINIDAHTDLRTADYRHSGNGFRYALENTEGSFIDRYVVFGLHKNYTPQYIYAFIKERKEQIQYYMLEDMLASSAQHDTFAKASKAVASSSFGIELDCDSIAYFPSSAQSPSGFTIETVRAFMQVLGTYKKSVYLHICEAAPTKKNHGPVGKALAYFVTDFIRSQRDHSTL